MQFVHVQQQFLAPAIRPWRSCVHLLSASLSTVASWDRVHQGASWVQTSEVRSACLILPLTHPRYCDGTGPPQLKIAHNQSTGRHISVLLKHINERCRGWIDGWQDSESIDMDMLFGITSSRRRPVLISCASVRLEQPALGPCWKKYLQWSKVYEGQQTRSGRGFNVCLNIKTKCVNSLHLKKRQWKGTFPERCLLFIFIIYHIWEVRSNPVLVHSKTPEWCSD